MRTQVRRSLMSFATAAVAAGIFVAASQTVGQAQGGAIVRTSWDKKPDFNGIWQAINTANWDLEDHNGARSPVVAAGNWLSIPPGMGVVEGGPIPYKPEALVQREKNRKAALTGNVGYDETRDPEANCYLPGIPRATYMNYPFQIFQSPGRMWMVYGFSYARREIHLLPKPVEAPIEFWMGTSNGRWEGDTLVIDVTGNIADTWFDRAGNFHTDALKVTERYTMIDKDHLNYEATIEDPNVFTRPWKISMPLYRRIDRNMQVLEFKCAEFTEEFWWGDLRKK